MIDPTIWVLTTGEAGMRAQAVGLAEAIGSPFIEKRIALRAPWRWLPGHLCPFALRGLSPDGDDLAPPWPDLLITCGRRSTAASIAIRRASGGRTLTVHLQNPLTPVSAFDLVVAHPHDGITGDNVLLVETTIHRASRDTLAQAAERFANLRALPSPLLGVLLGGRTKHGGFSQADTARLVETLAAYRAAGGGLMVTASRRTEPHVLAALKARFGDDPAAFIWDGSGENPYFAILALADRLLVTADSTSMVSEALSAGKPVDLFFFAGLGRRHRLFAERLERLGYVGASDRPAAPRAPKPEDAGRVTAKRVLALLAERRKEL